MRKNNPEIQIQCDVLTWQQLAATLQQHFISASVQSHWSMKWHRRKWNYHWSQRSLMILEPQFKRLCIVCDTNQGGKGKKWCVHVSSNFRLAFCLLPVKKIMHDNNKLDQQTGLKIEKNTFQQLYFSGGFWPFCFSQIELTVEGLKMWRSGMIGVPGVGGYPKDHV